MKDDRGKFAKKELIPLLLIVFMFVMAFYLYPRMPQKMPVHWNFNGEIDGYGSRFTGLFLMPLIALGIFGIMTIVPYIAVYKKNIKAFYFYYFGFKMVFVLFMLVLYIIMLLPNFNIRFNMNYLLMPLIAGLIYFSGVLMKRSKRNFFIGIRTPWTLASDKVWNKTHKLGASGFKVIAVFMVLAIFLGKYALLASIAALLLFVVYLVYYSYSLYSKENPNGKI